MSACVIPFGPEFEDEPNYPPFIEDSDPGVGEVFTPGQDEEVTRVITVTLGDDNVNDVLYLRWILDYPSSDGGQLLMAPRRPPSGKVERSPIKFVPMCPKGVPAAQHRLVLSVSDREFLDSSAGDSVPPEAPRDAIIAGANRMRALWILNCP